MARRRYIYIVESHMSEEKTSGPKDKDSGRNQDPPLAYLVGFSV